MTRLRREGSWAEKGAALTAGRTGVENEYTMVSRSYDQGKAWDEGGYEAD